MHKIGVGLPAWQGLKQRSACVAGLTTEVRLRGRAYNRGQPAWQGLRRRRSACVAGLTTGVRQRGRAYDRVGPPARAKAAGAYDHPMEKGGMRVTSYGD